MSIGRDSISATAKNVFLLGKVDLRSIFDFDKMRRRNFDKSASGHDGEESCRELPADCSQEGQLLSEL
jgi:hypothetical protein